ncbi:unnamed protein product, partial [Durusdinium trenchii]
EELAKLEQQRVEEEQAIAKKAAAVARREELQREAEAAAVAETRRLQAEHESLDAQARLERHEAAERTRKAKKAAAKEAKLMRKKRRMLALDSDESGSEAEKERGTWNSNNPDIRFLSIQGEHVTFKSDQFADHCVALTRRPMFYGRHFYEFHIHHFSDQLRCGVTTDAIQAGAQVAGHNLRGWCYYSGQMNPSRKALSAGLQINNKVVQDFTFMTAGDAIGVIVDADRWSVAFLRNRVLQGSCAMASPTREPLFLLVHLDAAADHVELRKVSLEEAPPKALEELDSFTPPSWSILVSDCSSVESEAPISKEHPWASPIEPASVKSSGPPRRPLSQGPSKATHRAQGSTVEPLPGFTGPKGTLRSSKSSSALERAGAVRMQKRPSSSSLLAAGAVLSRPQSAEKVEKAKSESPKKTLRPREPQRSELALTAATSSHQSFVEQTFLHPQRPDHPDRSVEPQSLEPGAASTLSLKARLRELKECFDEGLLTQEEFQQEKAIVLKAMRPGAPQPPAAAAQPCAAAQGSAQTTAHPPASTQRILPPVTVGATEASRPTTGVPNVPASLLGTSFSAPWVQRDVTSHYAEGWSDQSSMTLSDVQGRSGFAALLDHCAAAFE